MHKFYNNRKFVIWDDLTNNTLQMRDKYRAEVLLKRLTERGVFVYEVIKSLTEPSLVKGEYLSTEEFQEFVDENPHLFV